VRTGCVGGYVRIFLISRGYAWDVLEGVRLVGAGKCVRLRDMCGVFPIGWSVGV
jgi:hypothetical protein